MNVMTVHNRFEEKTVRRGRFGITRGQAILFLATFALFFYLLTELVFASGGTTMEVHVKEVTVRSGDSLWSIAVRHHEEAHMDVNDLILAIKKANELNSVVIYPGQTLVIPMAQ